MNIAVGTVHVVSTNREGNRLSCTHTHTHARTHTHTHTHAHTHTQWRIQDFSDGGAHTWFWKCDVTKTTFFLLAGVEAMFVHAQNLVALDSNEPRYNSRRGSARRCVPSLDPPLHTHTHVRTHAHAHARMQRRVRPHFRLILPIPT